MDVFGCKCCFIPRACSSESAVYKLHTDSSVRRRRPSSASRNRHLRLALLSPRAPVSTSTARSCTGIELVPQTRTMICQLLPTEKTVRVDGDLRIGARCKKLLSGAAFLADGSCLVTDNGASSMKVSLYADGSATFLTYRGTSCSGTVVKSTKVTKASISSHSCENGALKFYSGSATTRQQQRLPTALIRPFRQRLPSRRVRSSHQFT
ncbi:hypothetical protein GQ600_14048 [Phytophthora cactorum]|nr:hypothetical protein GQ600_14048 [Phytophthora cactorum]